MLDARRISLGENRRRPSIPLDRAPPIFRALAALAFAALLVALARPASAAPLRVLVPDNDNLQYMSFWVAKAAGFFHDEGVDVELVVPEAPAMTPVLLEKGEASVFVLPPPMYLELIARRTPIVLVANLLQNDPINLVVRRSVMEQRGLSATAPIADRLRGLHGLRIGVAPNPPARLRALFAAYGLDADHDIEMAIFHGRDQNAAFAEGKVDALYAHTPYVETALVDQDAVMLVNQSSGEVPALAMRQIHALAVTREFRDKHTDDVFALTRAILRAQRLVHDDPRAAAAALAREFPKVDPRHLVTIVDLYAPAVPPTPRVSVAGLAPALALFPASRKAPDLSGIALEPYVDPVFADTVAVEAERPASGPRALAVATAVAIGVATALALLALRRRQGRAIARRTASTTAT